MKAIITGNNVPVSNHYFTVGDVVEVLEEQIFPHFPTVFECVCVRGSNPGLTQSVDASCFEQC